MVWMEYQLFVWRDRPGEGSLRKTVVPRWIIIIIIIIIIVIIVIIIIIIIIIIIQLMATKFVSIEGQRSDLLSNNCAHKYKHKRCFYNKKPLSSFLIGSRPYQSKYRRTKLRWAVAQHKYSLTHSLACRFKFAINCMQTILNYLSCKGGRFLKVLYIGVC